MREGLGCLLTFDHLVDTSPGSGLVFLPLAPRLETRIQLIWRRYQMFSPIAERFLEAARKAFSGDDDRMQGVIGEHFDDVQRAAEDAMASVTLEQVIAQYRERVDAL